MTTHDDFEPSDEITDFLFQADRLSRKPGTGTEIESIVLQPLPFLGNRAFESTFERMSGVRQSKELVKIAALFESYGFAPRRVSKKRVIDATGAAKLPERLDKLRLLVTYAEEHFGSVPLYRPEGAPETNLPAYDVFDAQNHTTLESHVGAAVPVLDATSGDGAEAYRQALTELPGIVWEDAPDTARKSLFGLISADIVSVTKHTAELARPLAGAASAPAGAPPGTPPPPSPAHVWFTLTTHTPGIQVLWWWWALYGGFTPMWHLTSRTTNKTSEYMHSGGVGFSRVDPSHTSSIRYIDDPSRHAIGPSNPDGSTTTPTAF